MSGLIFTALIFGGMYFFLIRPQQQRVRQHAALVASVAVGDEVVTSGGIVGTITAVNERDVIIEVAPKVHLKVVKGAVAQKAPSELDAGATE